MNVREEMQQVAVKILEDWALMLVEAETSPLGVFEAEEDLMVGSLHFHGIVSGRYQVICQSPFARTLAANLLGVDDDARPEDMLDALKEMVNVMSGNLLTSSYGEDAVFALTSPEVTTVPREQLEEILGKVALVYRADDQPVVINFIPEFASHDD